ncbi:MAG: LysR family transcriptional regulator [Sphingomonadales bacterium]|nr:LysR family transcriptional regulator [Sphingomonadales bacterium]
MSFDNWDEIRTAFQVARVGTVSGAAEVLGVHHATVIRHVDALEARLGSKLFQRHPRGYTPTEAGQQLLAVGQATEDQFNQLAARIAGAGEEVTGELIITSLPTLSGLVLPALDRLLADHPGLRLRYLTDQRVFRLEYGEAHVAIRAGNRPTEPDNVVQPLGMHPVGVYAAQAYIDRHGRPTPETLAEHRFIGPDNRETRAPFFRWLAANVPDDQVVFRANDPESQVAAVRAGLGVGFVPALGAVSDAALIEVAPPRPDWESPLWLVSHVDLHRTPKVQAALRALKTVAVQAGLTPP